MFIHHRTQGIILKKLDRGEADQLLTVITKDFGKIEVLGKAMRKITSKLKPSAEPLSFSDIEFIEGKRYKTLVDARLIERFPRIRASLPRSAFVLRMAERADAYTGLEEQDRGVFFLLRKNLLRLEKMEAGEREMQLFFLRFLWKLFAALGYRPQVSACVRCGRADALAFFSSQEGGVVCKGCFPGGHKEDILSVDAETISALRVFLEEEWESALAIPRSPLLISRLQRLANAFAKEVGS